MPIARLTVRWLVDRSDLPDARSAIDDGGWAERALGRADEVCRPEPGSRPPSPTKLPRSRDFR